MAKLARSTFPPGHGPDDFQCFGPPATHDGEFEGCMIADLGFFSQDDKDSNKYYHGAVVQSRKDKAWYAYFEFGRTGVGSPQFQFEGADTKEAAQAIFARQMHEKNDKRGVWTEVAGLKTLAPKPGKDCYLVRSLAKRVTGLPDARTITVNEGAKPQPAAETAKPEAPEKAKGKAKPKVQVDPQTSALLRDLRLATIEYTRTSMADASLPTQRSIDDARTLLTEALKRVKAVGGEAKDQANDAELRTITGEVYKRIPRHKPRNAAPELWILSASNILQWQQDLDAFESALYAEESQGPRAEPDPYQGMNIRMEWLAPESATGKFLRNWWPNATQNKHGNIKGMEIVNAWLVEQKDQSGPFKKRLGEVKVKAVAERPLHQPDERPDLSPADRKAYQKAHVFLGFHGTRSVNVPGILRERLRLPKQLVGVVINGAMFGGGIYWADDWKKSAQYTSLGSGFYSSGAGGVKGRHAFMFAADVIAGSPHLAKEAHGFTAPPDGHHCVFGKQGVTRSWGGHLLANEWIIYESPQHQMRYLIEFKAS
ncbi:MAG: WGR domain-containing protein [Isosphaeraceae bacterium]